MADHLTTLLAGASGPEGQAALNAAFARAYAELKVLARRQLNRLPGVATLQPSGLVHEAYLKLAEASSRDFAGSAHFFNTLARAMRQILLDLAKERGRLKHGGDWQRTEIPEQAAAAGMELDELLAIDRALEQLRRLDPELAEVVDWHFFAGRPFVEIATLQGVTERTVRRRWEAARALLNQQLGQAPQAAP
jgi:RNA polymerase sigma factor (TIGR02999 family)